MNKIKHIFFTIYSIRGLGRVFHKIPVQERQELTKVMLEYVKNLRNMITNTGRG